MTRAYWSHWCGMGNKLVARRWWPLWAWAGAALILLFVNRFEARAVATTWLLFFAPGWACLEAWAPRPQNGVWRIILAASLSLVFTSLATLYLAYLPGPLTDTQVLIACAVVSLPLLAVASRRQHPSLEWPDRRLWLLLALVLMLAAALRLPRLGYAEFEEDEVEVTSLAVRTIKGEDYAVFLHRKGPVQMLIPAAGWLLAGRITEGWARLPFALAILSGILAVMLLAHRVAGWPAGLTAGLVLALNGYLIAFSRWLQFTAFIFCLAAVMVYCLWQTLEEGDDRLIWPAALGLAVSLLAHYDALVYVPVAAYLYWRIWRRWPGLRRTLLASSLVALVVLLSFYAPYVRDPQFEHTQSYLLENRVGTGWLYNNLGVLRRLDALYSSRFYLPVLWALSLVLAWRYRPPGKVWAGMLGIAILAAWTTMRWPELWRWGGWDVSLIAWLVVLAGVGIGLYRHRPGYEVFWIWWGGPLLAYVFLVGDPRAHLYVIYPGWAMLAGLGAATLWQGLAKGRRLAIARPLLAAAGALLAVLVAGYQVIIFLSTEPRLQEIRAAWEGTPGKALYGGLPEPRSYLGYPRRVGWKAAGWLISSGRFPGDFRSVGENFSVPVWYTYETPRSCYADPELYLVAQPPDTLEAELRQQLATSYVQAGTIYSEGYPRIGLYVKGAGVGQPERFELADLESNFDLAAAPGRFGAGERPAHPLEARFGDVAQLLGFGLASPEVRAGEVLAVQLYWRSLAETGVAYRAFVHLGENPVWGQHDDDPACRLPTTLWRAGQTAIGQFRVVPSVETPPGDYPLVIGLYDPVSGERLPVEGVNGQMPGDSLMLTTVRVIAP